MVFVFLHLRNVLFETADRALNTPFALVKTRPLKNAIRESKLKAETVAPLPATRPKTCTAMARRLVSSALGLKVNVSPALLNAERTLLANAKGNLNVHIVFCQYQYLLLFFRKKNS